MGKKRKFVLEDNVVHFNLEPRCDIEVTKENKNIISKESQLKIEFKGKYYLLKVLKPERGVDYSHILKRCWRWYRSQVYLK